MRSLYARRHAKVGSLKMDKLSVYGLFVFVTQTLLILNEMFCTRSMTTTSLTKCGDQVVELLRKIGITKKENILHCREWSLV